MTGCMRQDFVSECQTLIRNSDNIVKLTTPDSTVGHTFTFTIYENGVPLVVSTGVAIADGVQFIVPKDSMVQLGAKRYGYEIREVYGTVECVIKYGRIFVRGFV